VKEKKVSNANVGDSYCRRVSPDLHIDHRPSSSILRTISFLPPADTFWQRSLRTLVLVLVVVASQGVSLSIMKVFDTITEDLQDFIRRQKMFFVATAPLASSGHVNLSPKGYDCFRIIDETTVCYLDMTGSGNETASHIGENGRLTFMWCAVDGSPVILRLYGRGEVVLRPTNDEDDDDDDAATTGTGGNSNSSKNSKWHQLVQMYFPTGILPSSRQIIINHVERVQTSCGYGVPYFDYREDRETLKKYFTVKEKQEGAMETYWQEKNMVSIDGIVSPYGAKVTGTSSTSPSSVQDGATEETQI
jgi:Pyridoxamine 5'-phosphate oxidase